MNLIKRITDKLRMKPLLVKPDVSTRFLPPFRVGKKQMRAVLDGNGKEVVTFPKGLEDFALEYSQHLNRIYPNGC